MHNKTRKQYRDTTHTTLFLIISCDHDQTDLKMPFTVNTRRATRRGRPSLPFFENQKKCPDFGKKCPDCVHP